jgi:hypothetical protein
MAETFNLTEISPCWAGQRIVACREPLERGLTRLRTQCEGQQFLGFALISDVDYDGLMEWIDGLEAYENLANAEADLGQRLAIIEERILGMNCDGSRWAPVQEEARYPTMWDGRSGSAIMARKFKTSIEYDTLRVQMILIDRAKGDLVEQLLKIQRWQSEVVDALERLGGAGRPLTYGSR